MKEKNIVFFCSHFLKLWKYARNVFRNAYELTFIDAYQMENIKIVSSYFLKLAPIWSLNKVDDSK